MKRCQMTITVLAILTAVAATMASTAAFDRITQSYFDKGPVAIASHNGSLYVLGNELLHRVDPTDGFLKRVTQTYFDKGPVALASHNGKLYLLGNEKLYIVNTEDGSLTRIGDKYFDKSFAALASHKGALYVVGNELLWRVREGDSPPPTAQPKPTDTTAKAPPPKPTKEEIMEKIRLEREKRKAEQGG